LVWKVEISATAEKQIAKLDRPTQRAIRDYLRDRVLASDNPRTLGKTLTGPLAGLWRYRVGDLRVLCQIRDEVLVVLVLRAAHRREVYR
jgi:mRNA interferase RelE/StbE